MSKFGMYAKFTAHPGQRGALAEILLESAEAAGDLKECELYLVNLADDDADILWVTEVWSNPEAHAASLQLDATKAAIRRAMPLIAGVESTTIRPVGGKGLSFE